MNSLKINEIISKTNLKQNILANLEKIYQSKKPYYNILFIQIISIDLKNSSLIISDSKNAFLALIPRINLEKMKNSINPNLHFAKLIGCFATIRKWELIINFNEKNQELEINLLIQEIHFIDGLENECIRSNRNKELDIYYFNKWNFSYECFDCFKEIIYRLKKKFLRENYYKEKNNNFKNNLFFTKIIQEFKKDINENVKKIDQNINQLDIIPKNSLEKKKLIEIPKKIINIKEETKNNVNNLIQINSKSNKKIVSFKLIYNYEFLSKIILPNEKNNDEYDESSISDINSIEDNENEMNAELIDLNLDSNKKLKETIQIENNTNKKNVVKENEIIFSNKKRKIDDSPLITDSIGVFKLKKIKNDNNLNYSQEEKMLNTKFSLDQIQLYQSLLQQKNNKYFQF